ncbi:MAG: hypothetical protein ABS81_10255 [Pseudonocardia sp. SCN 72-86]|nr:MAG: hypothetical protein ABS81_10255 [Pseudonocardia sp. SCN 72-86]
MRLVINLHAPDGRAAEYAQAWSPRYDEVNAEPGCVQYELFTSARNPDNVAVLEWWDSRESFDAHWRREQTRTQPGTELLGRAKERRVGRNTTEIYWDRADYRFDPATELWTPR